MAMSSSLSCPKQPSKVSHSASRPGGAPCGGRAQLLHGRGEVDATGLDQAVGDHEQAVLPVEDDFDRLGTVEREPEQRSAHPDVLGPAAVSKDHRRNVPRVGDPDPARAGVEQGQADRGGDIRVVVQQHPVEPFGKGTRVALLHAVGAQRVADLHHDRGRVQ